MNDFYVVDPKKLKSTVAAIMHAEGVPEHGANVVAENLVYADLSNLQSHGVQRVKYYTDSIELGGTNPTCKFKVVSDSAGCAVIDAQCGLGIVAAHCAMNMAIEKAHVTGIGMVNVRNSNHCSCTAAYVMMATSRNMLGIASSNAPKSMAPWGSREKFLGTNPLAIGVPTHGAPIIIDMATSVVARGKIILADKKGEPIPEGWAIDAQGNPTTDAAKALQGCVLPFGGAKGSGIAMMIDIFCGVLSGSAYGKLINSPFTHPELSMNTGHCMIAVDISKFQDTEVFLSTMDSYREEVKGLARASWASEIYMPGEIEQMNYRKNMQEGIRLPNVVYSELAGLCDKLNLPFDICKDIC